MNPSKAKIEAPPKHGDLRIWWVPQIPMKSFTWPVASVAEAKVLLDCLAMYDQFQLANNVKPDYCNAGGLSAFDARDYYDSPDGSWVDWHSADGDEIDAYTLDQLRAGVTWESA